MLSWPTSPSNPIVPAILLGGGASSRVDRARCGRSGFTSSGLAIVGTLLGREPSAEEKYAELTVRANTGIGAEKAVRH